MVQTDTPTGSASPLTAAQVLPPAIHLAGLGKSFGPVRAVDGVDLTVHRGEVVAFLGPNGAGKSTTIDIVLGLSRPSAGVVEVFGMPPGDAVAHGLVAAVLQSGGLLKDLTVAETVRLTAALFADTRSVHEVLHRAGIADIADRLVGRCSGGQQQRLRFAMALLPDPELLVLDEPTTGMDVEGRREFWSAIRTDASSGRTVVFATHYLDEADAYADRVVLVSRGRIVADGTASQLNALASGRTVRARLPDPASPETAATVGATLRAIPGVQSVEMRAGTVLVHSRDTDAAARYLLSHTDASDLEIASRNLEAAFLALTSDDPASPTANTPGPLR